MLKEDQKLEREMDGDERERYRIHLEMKAVAGANRKLPGNNVT